jgi:N-acetyl-gamma-glutamyl-phosphate reductase
MWVGAAAFVAIPGAASPDALRKVWPPFTKAARWSVSPGGHADRTAAARSMEPSDALTLHVFANDAGRRPAGGRARQSGQGRQRAAVQSLNLMAGLPETAGLAL